VLWIILPISVVWAVILLTDAAALDNLLGRTHSHEATVTKIVRGPDDSCDSGNQAWTISLAWDGGVGDQLYCGDRSPALGDRRTVWTSERTHGFETTSPTNDRVLFFGVIPLVAVIGMELFPRFVLAPAARLGRRAGLTVRPEK